MKVLKRCLFLFLFFPLQSAHYLNCTLNVDYASIKGTAFISAQMLESVKIDMQSVQVLRIWTNSSINCMENNWLLQVFNKGSGLHCCQWKLSSFGLCWITQQARISELEALN